MSSVPITGMGASDQASAESMAFMDQATANIIKRQTIQNVESAEADAAISNAQQVGQTLSRSSSV
jgi:hypothetical protein